MGARPISATDFNLRDQTEGEVAFALAQAQEARTPLGRRLWEIRARIVASGVPLLSWDEIDREVADRRGGVGQDDS